MFGREIVNFSIMKAKTILITGATSGIGGGLRQKICRKRRRLILNGRNTENLIPCAVNSALGSEVQTLPFDVRDREAMSRAMASLPEGWDNIDVLVNNARTLAPETTRNTKVRSRWDTVIDTNIRLCWR